MVTSLKGSQTDTVQRHEQSENQTSCNLTQGQPNLLGRENFVLAV